MVCITEESRSLLSRHLGPDRRRHSLEVARLSALLARRYGADPQKAELAGLVHDLAREMDGGKLLHLAARDGRPISEMERERPVLLHGRAAAVLIREELGVRDEEILEAVAQHVTGRPGMGLLAKIVFIADFLEPGRGFIDDSFRDSLLGLDIDEMMIRVMERIFAFLNEAGRPIAEPARELMEELRRNDKKKTQMG
jgi:predicted HD superfamily hydrolase involved in NAD metabolism